MISLFIALCSIYFLRIVVFTIGLIIELGRFKKTSSGKALPFVSVVVPARNETTLIKDCLISISKNNYPIDKYEIIAVNDRSTDNTGEILDSMLDLIPNLIVIHNDNEKAIKNLRGKPGALQLGINSSKGDIILMTDADCLVNDQWIYSNARGYSDDDLGMTAAFTNVINDNFFSSLQSVEWMYLHTLAVGGIGLNLPYGCFGNNISLSKEKFEKIGGYEALKFSVTEDLAMLQFMHDKGYKLRHLSNHESTINTLPNKTLKEYINQHHRWILGGTSLGMKAFAWMLTAVALWVAIIFPLITGDYYLSLIALALRFVSDLIIMIPSMFRLRRLDLFPYLLPASIFLMILELVTPLLTLKRDVRWKDQVFYDAESKYEEFLKLIAEQKKNFTTQSEIIRKKFQKKVK